MVRAEGAASTARAGEGSGDRPSSPNDVESLRAGIVGALPEQFLADQTYLLGRLGREARRRFTRVLGAWGLHPPHYGVLLLLEAVGRASQQHLARTLATDRANMVALLDALEQRGFVERRADPLDRRRNAVELTAVGREVLRRMRRAREEVDDAFLAGLDDEERETLRRLLVKLFVSLTEQRSVEGPRTKEGERP